jgi:hypothetical protein
LKISPDGEVVVYRADQDQDEVFELYSVPRQGGGTSRISGPLASGGDVQADFEISPDSSRVVYRAQGEAVGRTELYSVPIAGGPSVKLNQPATPVHAFALAAGGTTVVFHGGPASTAEELYAVPIAGGQILQLSANAPVPSMHGFKVSPDGHTAVYHAGDQVLYSVPVAGGPRVQLTPTLPPGAEIFPYNNQQISPDSSRVVYLAEPQDFAELELFSVGITGGPAVKLNPPLDEFASIDFSWIVRIAPDSQRALFTVINKPGGSPESGLWSARITGAPAPVRLDDRPNFDVAITPDGWVAYSVAGTLKSTKIDASLSNVLYQAPAVDSISLFALADDTVVFRAAQDQPQVFELLRVPLLGGQLQQLSGTLGAGGDVGSTLEPRALEGEVVLYYADQLADERVELFVAPLTPDADGDTVLDACDLCPAAPDPDQLDNDGDGHGAACECDDDQASVHPGAAELNDGQDNQCHGDGGFGIVDELEGIVRFLDPQRLAWPAQPGASGYQVAIAERPRFTGCETAVEGGNEHMDAVIPSIGAVRYYLVRAFAPHVGSWGRDSAGIERSVPCAP